MWAFKLDESHLGKPPKQRLLPLDMAVPVTIIEGFLSSDAVYCQRSYMDENIGDAVPSPVYDKIGNAQVNTEVRDSLTLDSIVIEDGLRDVLLSTMKFAALERYNAPITKTTSLLSSELFALVYGEISNGLALHADAGIQQNGRWVQSVTSRHDMSALLYLSTSGVDFEGGELVFPYIVPKELRSTVHAPGFTYKPKAGDLVMFPSHALFAHRVTPSQGARYLIGAWAQWLPL